MWRDAAAPAATRHQEIRRPGGESNHLPVLAPRVQHIVVDAARHAAPLLVA